MHVPTTRPRSGGRRSETSPINAKRSLTFRRGQEEGRGQVSQPLTEGLQVVERDQRVVNVDEEGEGSKGRRRAA
jgi:hypothetical protein